MAGENSERAWAGIDDEAEGETEGRAARMKK
jgi:hypothetical protein